MRPFRARSSITSTILDDLDASDDLDVATNVATRPPIRGNGGDADYAHRACGGRWRQARPVDSRARGSGYDGPLARAQVTGQATRLPGVDVASRRRPPSRALRTAITPPPLARRPRDCSVSSEGAANRSACGPARPRCSLQAIAKAEAVRGNVARPVRAPTLCLCKRRKSGCSRSSSPNCVLRTRLECPRDEPVLGLGGIELTARAGPRNGAFHGKPLACQALFVLALEVLDRLSRRARAGGRDDLQVRVQLRSSRSPTHCQAWSVAWEVIGADARIARDAAAFEGLKV
jgi:hypothetical protein